MNVDITKETQRIISFCTGMRGIERGLERTGIDVRTLCYVEIEAFLIWNLVTQMEKGLLDEAPIWSNLKTFPAQGFRDKVHGIIGGYPCQPFSLAGQQKGESDPRHLWPFIREHIRTIRPIWCFFENVANHLNIGYETVRGELQDLGYRVEEDIFSADEVGASHQRKRLFILAIKLGYAPPSKRTNGSVGNGTKHSIIGSTSIMGNTGQFSEGSESNGFNGWEKGDTQKFGSSERNRFTNSGEILGNTNNSGSGTSEYGTNGKWAEENERWEKQSLSGFSGSSEIMADTSGTRNETGISEQEQWEERNSKKLNDNSYRDRFPAKPGQEQYEWEEPRVKPSMGFTINGYNFREDLLRMAGNGVVEQQAEKAWITLLNKHAWAAGCCPL